VYDHSFRSEKFGTRLCYIDDVVVCLLESQSDVLCRNIGRQMHDNGFNRFIRRFVKCKEVEIFLMEAFLWRCSMS
jgi:hypothetical protein